MLGDAVLILADGLERVRDLFDDSVPVAGLDAAEAGLVAELVGCDLVLVAVGLDGCRRRGPRREAWASRECGWASDESDDVVRRIGDDGVAEVLVRSTMRRARSASWATSIGWAASQLARSRSAWWTSSRSATTAARTSLVRVMSRVARSYSSSRRWLEESAYRLDPAQLDAFRAGADAATRLVEAHLHLVVPIAARYRREAGNSHRALIEAGNRGLMRAVEKFDWRRSFVFSTYASW